MPRVRPPFRADRRRLAQVLDHLIEYAVRQAAPQVQEALPEVDVGVADPAVGHLDQHLRALGLGGGKLEFLQRLVGFDHGPCAHVGSLPDVPVART